MAKKYLHRFIEPPTKESLADFCRLLYDRHLVTGVGGNVSARFEDAFLVTPSGFSLRDVTPENVLVMRPGEAVAGPLIPSKELVMHFGIFKQRPEVNVVCHVHGHYIIAASVMLEPGEGSLPPLTPGFCFYSYPLPMSPFYVPGSAALADAVRARFADKNIRALLLQNHGLITAGANMAEAVNIAEEVDEAAKVFILSRGKSSLIPENLVDELF